MSEFRLEPIPTQLDYKAGFELSDEFFERHGGVRSHLMQVEYNASHGNSEIQHDNVLYTGKLALRLEPKNSRGIVEDKTMRITHAVKRGMLSAFYATQFVYDGRINASQIRRSIDTGIQHEEIDLESPFADEPPLLEWGGKGLEFIGEAATEITDRWAGRFYDDDYTKRLFRLGAGAVAATAHALAMNESLQLIDEILSTNNWDEELENLRRSNTGE